MERYRHISHIQPPMPLSFYSSIYRDTDSHLSKHTRHSPQLLLQRRASPVGIEIIIDSLPTISSIVTRPCHKRRHRHSYLNMAFNNNEPSLVRMDSRHLPPVHCQRFPQSLLA